MPFRLSASYKDFTILMSLCSPSLTGNNNILLIDWGAGRTIIYEKHCSGEIPEDAGPM